MDKVEKMEKLKNLFDSGALNEKEFLAMKNEILSQEIKNKIINSNLEIVKPKKGTLNICFVGKWFLFDAKTKLFVNGELHSTHSTKEGFNICIPIVSDKISLKLVLAGMKTSIYEIEELNISKNYTMELSYSEAWGRYSNEFNLTENG